MLLKTYTTSASVGERERDINWYNNTYTQYTNIAPQW